MDDGRLLLREGGEPRGRVEARRGLPKRKDSSCLGGTMRFHEAVEVGRPPQEQSKEN